MPRLHRRPARRSTTISMVTSAVDGTEADRLPATQGRPRGSPGSGGTGSAGAGGEVARVAGSGAPAGDAGPASSGAVPVVIGSAVRLRRTAPTTERSSGGRRALGDRRIDGGASPAPVRRSRPAVLPTGAAACSAGGRRRQHHRRGDDRCRTTRPAAARPAHRPNLMPPPAAAAAPGGRGTCPGGLADRSSAPPPLQVYRPTLRDRTLHRRRRPRRLPGAATAALNGREVARRRRDAEGQRKQNQRQPVGLVRDDEQRDPHSEDGALPTRSRRPSQGASRPRCSIVHWQSDPSTTLFRWARIQASRRPSRARKAKLRDRREFRPRERRDLGGRHPLDLSDTRGPPASGSGRLRNARCEQAPVERTRGRLLSRRRVGERVRVGMNDRLPRCGLPARGHAADDREEMGPESPVRAAAGEDRTSRHALTPLPPPDRHPDPSRGPRPESCPPPGAAATAPRTRRGPRSACAEPGRRLRVAPRSPSRAASRLSTRLRRVF